MAGLAPLLMPIALFAQFNLATVPYMLDGFSMPGEVAETLPPWSFWGQVAIFWVWGVALAIATIAYWVATRDLAKRVR